MSKRSFCLHHGLCGTSLLNKWIKKYDSLLKSLPLSSNHEALDMANRSKEDYKEENAQLKRRVKELEKALAFSKLETEARDLLITRAEEYFDIPIRKIWGQAVTELVRHRNLKVTLACRLFGHCRQAYYQSKADIETRLKNERLILDSVREIRSEDPGIGGYKLWVMLVVLFGSRFMPGRDSFYTLLRRHHLMLPPRKTRCTTNSNHRYHKWKIWSKDLCLLPPTSYGSVI